MKKTIKAYAVCNAADLKTFLTITRKKSDAFQYVRRVTVAQHFHHYNLWCDNHELNPDDAKSIDKYYSECLSEEDRKEFGVLDIKYDIDSLFAIIRMFGGHVPLGCPYELPIEGSYFNEQQAKNKIIAEKFKELEELKSSVKIPTGETPNA